MPNQMSEEKVPNQKWGAPENCHISQVMEYILLSMKKHEITKTQKIYKQMVVGLSYDNFYVQENKLDEWFCS